MQRSGAATQRHCKTQRRTPDINVRLSVANACDAAEQNEADLKLWSTSDKRTGGKAVPIKEIVRTRHIRRMSILPADIMLYQSCCTAASGGGVSTWTAASTRS